MTARAGYRLGASARALVVIAALAPLVACVASAPARVHTTTHANGARRWQVPLVDGVPDGPSTTWHPNGQVASRGTYRGGVRDGEFVYWDADGRELRRETFRDGERVRPELAPPPPGSEAPSVIAAAPPPRPRSVVRPPARYAAWRVALGMGGSSAAREVGNGPDFVLSLSGSLVRRRGRDLYGGVAHLAWVPFGALHSYLGATYGLSTAGDRVVAQALVEAGVHRVSNIGDGLFEQARGETSAVLPYAGGQLRVISDVGQRGGLVLEASIAGRADLGRRTREVTVEDCFWDGCPAHDETWRAGGLTVDAVFGVGYRF